MVRPPAAGVPCSACRILQKVDTVTGALVADLGLGPRTWMFVSLLAYVALFFKFTRLVSIRNLDLLILFAPAPGLLSLVGGPGGTKSWIAFAWLLSGSALILLRCLLDNAIRRRPFLEPNLNAPGLVCMILGVLGLLLAETVSLPRDEGAARNPALPSAIPGEGGVPAPKTATDAKSPVNVVLRATPLPHRLRRSPPQVVLSRVLAALAHLGMVLGLLYVGKNRFNHAIAGLACACCYLLSPYTRIAVVDSGQLTSAALILAAVALHTRPVAAAILLGLASAWIPACLGILPLWASYYRGRGMRWFIPISLAVVLGCTAASQRVPELAVWARALGARNFTDSGLRFGAGMVQFHERIGAPAGSFWTRIDPSYRLPVMVLYITLAGFLTFRPRDKDLGELISLSAALLVAAQFWYLDAGGTLILLYLPLVLLMVFRPQMLPKAVIRVPKLPLATERSGLVSQRAPASD